jgi:4-diphosphocytidyl-2-C-methyl-D-erythritol kinase
VSASFAVRILAPAKVNLWLRVLRRRPDGFHELDTLFQAVDLCDEVELSRGPGAGVGLLVEGAELGPARENLAYRAALAFLDAVGPAAGSDRVEILLRKRIPAGAGLGGGSSDAAAVLRCMSALWAHPLPPAVLAEVGASLGSDVAFFLGDGPLARGRGRGETLETLRPLPEAHLVLVLPPVHVATGPAYGALARHRAVHGAEAGDPPPTGTPTWSSLAEGAANDFEVVVPAAHPPVAASLEALRTAGARPALLSGSGGACFGAFPDGDRAREAGVALTAHLGWPAIPVRTLAAFPAPRPL